MHIIALSAIYSYLGLNSSSISLSSHHSQLPLAFLRAQDTLSMLPVGRTWI